MKLILSMSFIYNLKTIEVVYFLSLLIREACSFQNDLIINTDLGKILGKKQWTRDGREVLAFLGVPFAKPPVGDLRFRITEEIEPWDGVLNGTQFREQCSQIYRVDDIGEFLGPVGTEDCLYLNIFTPKKIEELEKIEAIEKLPVIVYIHGGVGNGNGSKFGHDYFLDEDIILIMIHFRLNIFANLNTEDEATSGNLGLKDQVLALKWIRKHISKFGGDPKKVTIYGNSAGSMHVSAQLICPMSNGLFQRAIMQSGTILYHNHLTLNPRKNAFELGEKVGCQKMKNSSELVNCLRKIDEKVLSLGAKNMEFGLSIESSSNDINLSCIPDNPVTLLLNGKINKVPLLQGVVSAEGIVTLLQYMTNLKNASLLLDPYNGSWEHFLKDLLDLSHVRSFDILSQIKDFYFHGYDNLKLEDAKVLIDVIGDREFNHPQLFYALNEHRHMSNNTPIYLYIFTKKPLEMLAKTKIKIDKAQLGPGHAEDLQYFFPSILFKKIRKDSHPHDYEFSKKLVKKWVNFANYGDPNGNRDDEKSLNEISKDKDEKWHPFDPTKEKNWYQLDDNLKMVDPFGERMDLWNSFDPYELYP